MRSIVQSQVRRCAFDSWVCGSLVREMKMHTDRRSDGFGLFFMWRSRIIPHAYRSCAPICHARIYMGRMTRKEKEGGRGFFGIRYSTQDPWRLAIGIVHCTLLIYFLGWTNTARAQSICCLFFSVLHLYSGPNIRPESVGQP